MQTNAANTATLLELVTTDRPGLLAHIGRLLEVHRLRLHHARILTEGAIAQDCFTITDRNNQPVIDQSILMSLESF